MHYFIVNKDGILVRPPRFKDHIEAANFVVENFKSESAFQRFREQIIYDGYIENPEQYDNVLRYLRMRVNQ